MARSATRPSLWLALWAGLGLARAASDYNTRVQESQSLLPANFLLRSPPGGHLQAWEFPSEPAQTLASTTACECTTACLSDPACFSYHFEETAGCRTYAARGAPSQNTSAPLPTGHIQFRDAMARLGDFCVTSTECTYVTEGSECNSSVCACAGDLVAAEGMCVTAEEAANMAAGSTSPGDSGDTASGGSGGTASGGSGGTTGGSDGTTSGGSGGTTSEGAGGTTPGDSSSTASGGSGSTTSGGSSSTTSGGSGSTTSGDSSSTTGASGSTTSSDSSSTSGDSSSTTSGSPGSTTAGGDSSSTTSSPSTTTSVAESTTSSGSGRQLATTASASNAPETMVDLVTSGPKDTSNTWNSQCPAGEVVRGPYMTTADAGSDGLYNAPSQMRCVPLVVDGNPVTNVQPSSVVTLNMNQMTACPNNMAVMALYGDTNTAFALDSLLCARGSFTMVECSTHTPQFDTYPGMGEVGACGNEKYMTGVKIKQNSRGEIEQVKCCVPELPDS